MGILRKLAGLVVEFPDQPQPAGPKPEQEEDVLAAIERARKDVEGRVEAAVEDLPVRPAAAPAGEGTPSSGISVPSILSIREIYSRAKVSPDDKAVGVDKAEAMLADPEMADLAPEIRARMVKLALKNMGHELHEIILDAARRDKALDQYGEWLAGKVGECEQQVAAANTALEKEIVAFTAERRAQIATNSLIAKQLHSDAEAFSRLKDAEEDRLFKAVAPFVAPGENPVVIDKPAKGPAQHSGS